MDHKLIRSPRRADGPAIMRMKRTPRKHGAAAGFQLRRSPAAIPSTSGTPGHCSPLCLGVSSRWLPVLGGRQLIPVVAVVGSGHDVDVQVDVDVDGASVDHHAAIANVPGTPSPVPPRPWPAGGSAPPHRRGCSAPAAGAAGPALRAGPPHVPRGRPYRRAPGCCGWPPQTGCSRRAPCRGNTATATTYALMPTAFLSRDRTAMAACQQRFQHVVDGRLRAIVVAAVPLAVLDPVLAVQVGHGDAGETLRQDHAAGGRRARPHPRVEYRLALPVAGLELGQGFQLSQGHGVFCCCRLSRLSFGALPLRIVVFEVAPVPQTRKEADLEMPRSARGICTPDADRVLWWFRPGASETSPRSCGLVCAPVGRQPPGALGARHCRRVVFSWCYHLLQIGVFGKLYWGRRPDTSTTRRRGH